MKRFAPVLVLAAALLPSQAEAYWQRSHWAACSEAPTEAERIRRNCYIFAPAYEWPLEDGMALGVFRSAPGRPLVRK